jgi:phage FluMu protein Com
MSITFACSHCGKQLTVSDDSGGMKARCPGCATIVEVPAYMPKMRDPPTAFGNFGASAAQTGGIFRNKDLKTMMLTLAKVAILAGVALILILSIIIGVERAAYVSRQFNLSALKKEVHEPPLKSDYNSDGAYASAREVYESRVKERDKKTKDLQEDIGHKLAAWGGSFTWRIIVLTLAYLLALGGCAWLFLFGGNEQSQAGLIGLFLLLISMSFTFPPMIMHSVSFEL